MSRYEDIKAKIERGEHVTSLEAEYYIGYTDGHGDTVHRMYMSTVYKGESE